MNRLIDAAVACVICGVKGVGNCACFWRCLCGWWIVKEATCTNRVHREPPRDVACSYCGAAIGQPCVQRNGIRQGWSHVRRVQASKAKSIADGINTTEKAQ